MSDDETFLRRLLAAGEDGLEVAKGSPDYEYAARLAKYPTAPLLTWILHTEERIGGFVVKHRYFANLTTFGHAKVSL